VSRPGWGRVTRWSIRRIIDRIAGRVECPVHRPLMTRSGRRRSAPAWIAPFVVGASGLLRCTGCPRRAQRLVERALTSRPDSAALWRELARCFLEGGPVGLVVDPILGVTPGPCGDGPSADAAARRSTELEPSTEANRLRARAAELSGDGPAAERWWNVVTDAADAKADDWYRFGRARALSASRRGGFDTSDFAAHNERLRHALSVQPRHRNARYHLCRVAIRQGDWATALVACAPENSHEVERLGAALSTGDGSAGAILDVIRSASSDLTRDAILVAHWWLLSHGATRAAYEAKDMFAARIVGDLRPEGSSSVGRIRALLQLGDLDAVHRETHALNRPGRLDPARAEKVAADVELALGDPARHVARHRHQTDDALRRLVEGRTVAIIGPAPDPSSSTVAAAEVVIRTKWLGTDDTRVDVAFYPETTSSSAASSIIGLLDRGALPLAVVRPGALRSAPSGLLAHGRVRVSPDELAVHLEASPFAIQRILYDVLAFAPESVVVGGTDFFASRGYRSGYDIDAQERRAGGIVDSLPGYGHDPRADLRWSQRLAENGIVRFTEPGSKVLVAGEDSYLLGLERPTMTVAAVDPDAGAGR
jgi:hypothetical protein